MLDECGSDFIALSGIELLCYPMLCLGGRGHLSCVGNFAPRPVAELYDAFEAGDHERARRLHYDLHALVDAAFAETNPAPAKWVMERLGLIGERPRPRAARAALGGCAGAGAEAARSKSARRRTRAGVSPTRIQIVFSRKPDGVSDEDWNTWYDAHLHEILAIPGFVSAQRYAIDQHVGAGEGPEWTHIAIYEVEGGFDELAKHMAEMHLDTAEAYVEYKRSAPSDPPLPPWWDDVRFASWNGRSLGERLTLPEGASGRRQE